MDTVRKVKSTIIRNNLIQKDDKVLVALSGGSDSVCMLHILCILAKEMGFSVFAAHINHNIREEARLDEMFVRDLCRKLGVECFVKSVDVIMYAKEKKISTELAGRQIRYEFFEELKNDMGFTKIATAHNKNDSAESILLHLIRGAGLGGLIGILPKRNEYIIRPIINLEKNEILKYCKNNTIPYVTDKTNFETDYTRNKIRLDIIPKITEDINENFVSTLTENSIIFKETLDFLEKYADRIYDKICDDDGIMVSSLIKEEKAVIRCIIQKHFKKFTNDDKKLSIKYVNEILNVILNNKTSKIINIPNDISAIIEYDRLFFAKNNYDDADYSYDIGINEEIYVCEAKFTVILKSEEEAQRNKRGKIYFYADENSVFKVRNRRKGDYLYPIGMEGKKKLSDFFIDKKIPKWERKKHPLLVCNEKIVWVVGERCDRRFSNGEILLSCEVIKNRS